MPQYDSCHVVVDDIFFLVYHYRMRTMYMVTQNLKKMSPIVWSFDACMPRGALGREPKVVPIDRSSHADFAHAFSISPIYMGTPSY